MWDLGILRLQPRPRRKLPRVDHRVLTLQTPTFMDDTPVAPEPEDLQPPAPPSPQPLSAEDGNAMEDTSFLYGEDSDPQESGDAEMSNALIDALRVVGVEPALASRFACANLKKAKSDSDGDVRPWFSRAWC